MTTTHHPRRKKLIDPHLQGRHWLLLIALELLVIGFALLYLYQGMQQALEDSLYAIHTSYRQAVVSEFLLLMGRIALITVLINIMLLALGHRLWVKRVRRLQQQLRLQLDSLAQLNFSASENLPGVTEQHHELSYLLSRWSQRERSRFRALIGSIGDIPDQFHQSQELSSDLQQQLKQALQQFLQIAPHPD